jgi:predicted metal-binding protein
LDDLFQEHGYADYKWIDPREIKVAQWVRMKCMFGCGRYGKNATCPPNTPSVAECERFFREYHAAAIFHFSKKPGRGGWAKKENPRLIKLERAVFLAGFERTFLLNMASCQECEDCPGDMAKCRNPLMARPSPEGMAVDVYSTARKFGFPIQVLPDHKQTMNRYAILMVE